MDISKIMSVKEEMAEKMAPSTQDEDELVEKEDNSREKGEEEEGGEGEEDGVNQVDSALVTNAEELLEKQVERGEDVEEVEQEVNTKGEQTQEANRIVSVSTAVSTDNTKTKKASLKKQKSKKGEAAMNVNNEVVKMRTEVKRVRALLIRKLLRHLADLKKKKGDEADLERNQRRVDRLLEEIRQMKRLRPDQVTKTALQNEFNFEKVCKDPTITMSQRALARIATHPQFSKKIDVIKAAVKAFDEERKKEKQKQKMTPFQEEEEQDALKQKEEETEDEEEIDEESKDEEVDDDDDNTALGGLSEPGTETAARVDETTETSDQMRSEILVRSKTVAVSKIVKMASKKNTEIKDILKETSQGKPRATKAPEKKLNLKPAPKMQQTNKDEEKQNNDDDKGSDEEEKESDLESSDEEEKEYFDDSTEERFHKQSEGSESEDDFFVGKVSKFKKKKKAHATPNLKSQTSDKGQTDKPQSEWNFKAPKLASVFCSLSSSKPSRGGLSRDRGRGRDRFRGRGRGGDRGGGPDRFSKGPSKFKKQGGGPRGKPEFKPSEHGSEARQLKSEDKDRTLTGRGTGRGRGGVARQQDHRGPGGFSPQAPQQTLHPSWEASKKRKEQQGQIMAFQGKKIKFDDDD